MNLTLEVQEAFAAGGVLSRAADHFVARDGQTAMALAVAHAIEHAEALVVEASTGVGKTFSYLVPALLSGERVLVSTATKALQDQLYGRDLPRLVEALGVPVSTALLKGRASYVCLHRVGLARQDASVTDRAALRSLAKIEQWAQTTKAGDLAELSGLDERSPLIPLVTSTRENCLGQECPNHQECFVLGARAQAMMADIVVVNHHLFFADVMLKDEGMGELLPACNTIIFDEAHQLPEVAGLFFGESISTTQLIDLGRDARMEGISLAKDYTPLQDAAVALDKTTRDLRLAVRGENLRLTAGRAFEDSAFEPALKMLTGAIAELSKQLESQVERGEGLANCLARAQALTLQLKRWRGDEAGVDMVRWVEVYSQALSLNLTPLDIAPIFQRQMEGHPRAWIFTSATLAVGSDFSHYCGELGLSEAETACWGSPFDYQNSALLYVPPDMPDPNSAFYQEAVTEAAWPALRAAGEANRGSFVLCTSLRAMRRIRELLEAKLRDDGIDLPLLMQGEGSRSELLERFRSLGNAILVASVSFWEGVDVRGDALSLVVIDKLPFAPPDDPVLAARIEKLRAEGRNPFMEYQLPRAVISMKQGAGRLIRDETDRGVLMICDPRMLGKPYGRRVWQSLPPMRRTREVSDVVDFFAVKSAHEHD